jgi:hypothetical protein
MRDVPDLAALREKAEAIIAAEGRYMSGYEANRIEYGFQNAWTPDRCLAVLALVDEQRDRISTLEEALARIKAMDNGDTTFYQERFWQATDIAHKALAGSPAENKEPT